MIFTTDNLLDNLDKLGPWSAYGLAEEALEHYFPDRHDYEEGVRPAKYVEMLDEMGLHYWTDVVEKYHKEVGYEPVDGKFNSGAVNHL